MTWIRCNDSIIWVSALFWGCLGQGILSFMSTDVFIHHAGYFCAAIRPLLSCSFTFQCPRCASRELFHIQPPGTFTHKLLSKFCLFLSSPRLPRLQLNLQSLCKSPHSFFFFRTHVHFADQISFKRWRGRFTSCGSRAWEKARDLKHNC